MGIEMECPKCKKQTLKHLHNTAHGIPGTHMAGSERFECPCGFYASDEETANKNGLQFILDRKVQK